MEDIENSKFVSGIDQVKFLNFVLNLYGGVDSIVDNTKNEYIGKIEHNKSAVLRYLGNKIINSNSKKASICKYFSLECSSCIACALLAKAKTLS